MVKEKTPQAGAEEKPATDAQIKLANELELEINYGPCVPSDVLRTQTREAVSAYIHKLKEIKVCNQSLRSQNNYRNTFDKIGFGMVYKLAWKAASKETLATKPSKQAFVDAVIGEYALFKDAQKQCREHAEAGDLQ